MSTAPAELHLQPVCLCPYNTLSVAMLSCRGDQECQRSVCVMLVDIYHGAAAFVALVAPFLAFTLPLQLLETCASGTWSMFASKLRFKLECLLLILFIISSATSGSYRAFIVVYVFCFVFLFFFCLKVLCFLLKTTATPSRVESNKRVPHRFEIFRLQCLVWWLFPR